MLNKVNVLISKLQFDYDKQSKIDMSIIKEIALKFARKSFSLLGKDKSKEYKITIEFHQAEALERNLRFRANLEYEMHQLDSSDYYMLMYFINYLHKNVQ